ARSSTRRTSREASCAAIRSRWPGGSRRSPRRRADRSATAWRGGAGTAARTTSASTARSPSPSSERICPRRTIGWTSTRRSATATGAPPLWGGPGLPAPRVIYALSENSRRMLDHGIARAREALAAAGAGAVAVNPLLRAGGWHLMGTARMGRDPATSGIDREAQCHDVANLYIAHASTIVTCAGVNPTSTIQAVALYIADGMIRRRA